MRLRKIRVIVSLLALPLGTGAVIALPSAVPATGAIVQCYPRKDYTNHYIEIGSKVYYTVSIPQAIFTVPLAYGSQGTCVKELQSLLDGPNIGDHLQVDGIFGSATQAAVRTFQTNHFAYVGSQVDGKVGVNTMSAIYWVHSGG